MGNAVPQRMCHSKEAVVASGARRRPRAKDAAAPSDAAAPRREGRRGRARAVSWAGADDDTAGGKAAPTTRTATVATVKIVLKRKDAEALVARLNAQTARERKARMAELKGELRTGECCVGGGGGASPASCRDAWRPRLATVEEN